MSRSDPLLLTLLLAACAPSSVVDDADLEPFDCELGALDAEMAWQPLTVGSKLELQLGFQGFLLVDIYARTATALQGALSAAVSLTPEGMDPLGHPEVRFQLLPDGDAYVSDPPLQVFLDAARLGTYVGKSATIAVRITGDGHRCTRDVEVVLADDDPCIHSGDGEPICPGDDTDTDSNDTDGGTP